MESESNQDFRIDIQSCIGNEVTPGDGLCYCLGCVGLVAGTTSCTIYDSVSYPINDVGGTTIGDVTLYYSYQCGAVWATTRGYLGPTVRIASFIFTSASPDAALLPNPEGLLNINSTGMASEWSAAMQAAVPGLVACGWVEYEVDGIVQQSGACTGDGTYINHPPVCTGVTIEPGEIFFNEAQGEFSQYMDIQGIYDPDGDEFEIKVESIYQSQPVVETGRGSGQTCPDANAEEGWVLLERDGVDPQCRRYRVSVSATDTHEETCDPHGESSVDIPHSARGGFVNGSDPFASCSGMAEPQTWYPSWSPTDCPR